MTPLQRKRLDAVGWYETEEDLAKRRAPVLGGPFAKSGEFSRFFRSADAEAVRSCLAGAHVRARDSSGRTTLHFVVSGPDKPNALQLASTPSDHVRGKVPRDWLLAVGVGRGVVNPCRAAGN